MEEEGHTSYAINVTAGLVGIAPDQEYRRLRRGRGLRRSLGEDIHGRQSRLGRRPFEAIPLHGLGVGYRCPEGAGHRG